MPTPVLRTPVLIAGAGVTGSLTALELALHGVPSVVVERSGVPSKPQDLALISGRGMELVRRLGLAGELRRSGVDQDRAVDIVWSHGLTADPVLVSRLPPPAELRRAHTAAGDGVAPIEPYLLIPGSALAGRLRRALHEHPLIDLRTRWTLTELRAEPDGVIATVLDAPNGLRRVVEAAYLAGCDGADSTVRRCAGLDLTGQGPAAPHVTVHFADAALAASRTNPAVLIIGGATVFTGHDGDRVVAHLPIAAADQAMVADPAGLLRRRLALARDPGRIDSVQQRAGAPTIAESYRRGRVLLAGQAAHQAELPGDDVDTCIGDAVGLGWRLAAAVHGWAGDELLDDYDQERRHRALLARELARRALQTQGRFQRLAATGTGREVLGEILMQDAPQLDPAGTGPVALAGTLGYRPPAFRLAGGEQLFDRLGPQFTLVDLTPGQQGWPLVTAARDRGVPVRHLPIAGAAVPAAWPGRLALIRPDQQVAWSADEPPADGNHILDEVTGCTR